jgi:hypothetical protein
MGKERFDPLIRRFIYSPLASIGLMYLRKLVNVQRSRAVTN